MIPNNIYVSPKFPIQNPNTKYTPYNRKTSPNTNCMPKHTKYRLAHALYAPLYNNSPILSTRLKYQINAPKHQVQKNSVKFITQNDFLVIITLSNKFLSVVWRYIYLVHPISKECANVYGYLQLKLSPKVGCNFWHSANTSQLKLH